MTAAPIMSFVPHTAAGNPAPAPAAIPPMVPPGSGNQAPPIIAAPAQQPKNEPNLIRQNLSVPSIITKPSAPEAEPKPVTMGVPGAPPMGAPPMTAAPLPSVKAPRGTLQGEQDEYAREVGSGSGISQIKNPFLRGLATTGNILGHVAAPGLMAQIPGTEEHHNILLGQQGNRVNTLLGQQQEQAKSGLLNAQASQIENPRDKYSPLATDTGYVSFDPQKGTAQPLTGPNGEQLSPAEKQQHEKTPEQTAFEALIQKGTDPVEAYTKIKQAGDIKDSSIQQQYLDALSSGDTSKQQAIEKTIRATSTLPKIDIHNASAAASDTRSRDANTEKEYMAAQKDLSTGFAGAQSQIDTIEQAKTELGGGAIGQALGTIKTLVGLAGGKGSGVRITQAELNSLLHARGVKGDMQGWLNGLEGKGNLSGEQQQQLNQVLTDVEGRLRQKQQSYNDTLDKLSGAKSTDEIRKIQSDYRRSLAEGSGSAPQGHVIEINGKQYQYKGSGPTDDMSSYSEVKQ